MFSAKGLKQTIKEVITPHVLDVWGEQPHVERQRIKQERKHDRKERDLDRREKRQAKHKQRY